VAGALGAAMYIDGKYAVWKDIHEMRRARLIAKLYAEAGKLIAY
jgi:hypothetical protein